MKKIFILFMIIFSMSSFAADKPKGDRVTLNLLGSCYQVYKSVNGEKYDKQWSEFCIPYVSGVVNAYIFTSIEEQWNSDCIKKSLNGYDIAMHILNVTFKHPDILETLSAQPAPIIIKVMTEDLYQCKFDKRQKS